LTRANSTATKKPFSKTRINATRIFAESGNQSVIVVRKTPPNGTASAVFEDLYCISSLACRPHPGKTGTFHPLPVIDPQRHYMGIYWYFACRCREIPLSLVPHFGGATFATAPTSPHLTLSSGALLMADLPLLYRLDKALRNHPHLNRQPVFVERQQDELVVRGTVRSFFHKQVIQEAIRKVDGDAEIKNLVEVQ
jgi:hypothetical protein